MLCIHICSAFYSVCLCLSLSKVNMVFDIELIFCFELFARTLDVKKQKTKKQTKQKQTKKRYCIDYYLFHYPRK